MRNFQDGKDEIVFCFVAANSMDFVSIYSCILYGRIFSYRFMVAVAKKETEGL